MKNTRDATSNSGACIPTNSKLYADASGPGVPTSGEHAVTTTESVATTDHTRNDASAQIVVVERGKGASANQELTKGESNVTAKDISSRRKEDATVENDPLNYHTSLTIVKKNLSKIHNHTCNSWNEVKLLWFPSSHRI